MIKEIMEILAEKRTITLADLAILTGNEQEVLEQLMEQLVRKKIATKEDLQCKLCSKECGACVSKGEMIVYKYLPNTK